MTALILVDFIMDFYHLLFFAAFLMIMGNPVPETSLVSSLPDSLRAEGFSFDQTTFVNFNNERPDLASNVAPGQEVAAAYGIQSAYPGSNLMRNNPMQDTTDPYNIFLTDPVDIASTDTYDIASTDTDDGDAPDTDDDEQQKQKKQKNKKKQQPPWMRVPKKAPEPRVQEITPEALPKLGGSCPIILPILPLRACCGGLGRDFGQGVADTESLAYAWVTLCKDCMLSLSQVNPQPY